ncbi:tryptophanyl-tRNA synthetase [Enteropsectra breve]|nr:tryptophanyl-tRNA synthetase [Enteropsectra breve]
MIITPWEVEAEKDGEEMVTINYDHIVTQFGCQKFTEQNNKDLEELIQKPSHLFLRRNLAFAHRDFARILEAVKSGEKFFLYTGRGPSSSSMHIGHTLPFELCRYLQECFKVPVVIQMTDDEKFLCKNISIPEMREHTMNNIKDIIAFGFDPKLTYIFSNYDSSHLFTENTLKISKAITINDVFKVFGFNMSTCIGMAEFPARQIAAAFSSSFSFLEPGMQCLIPAAVDQDPYFRLARDKAFAIGEKKPSTLYMQLLPDLRGTNRKMSASETKSSIYLNDSMSDIKNKINKYAFSGGQETLEMHRELGGNPDVDVPFQYLRFFLDDDEELERLRNGYLDGTVLTGQMKKRCIEVVQSYMKKYQERRAAITEELISEFMSPKK